MNKKMGQMKTTKWMKKTAHNKFPGREVANKWMRKMEKAMKTMKTKMKTKMIWTNKGRRKETKMETPYRLMRK